MFQKLYAPSVVNNAIGTLRAVFAEAVNSGARFGNPAANLSRVRIRAKRLELPSREEFLRFVEEIRTARAIEETTVLLIPKLDFIELLRRRPELALRMLGSMSQHLRVLVGLLDDLTLKNMETRVANWLLKRCPRPLPNEPVEIQLDRTKRVLAAETGATSETLSRTLGKFRDEKLLRIKGKL